MKVNYQRGESFKKKKKVGKFSTYMKWRNGSYCYIRKLENRKFRNQVKECLRHNNYDLLPVPKKRIWWDC